MRIERIDIHPLYVALNPPYGDANGPKYYRASMIVEVTMSNGIIGFGEATGRLPRLANEATERYSRVIGMDARNIRHVLRQLGNVPSRIRSGLEIALWDALGKLTELPLYRLLGGSHRTELSAYASLQNIPYREATSFTQSDVAKRLFSTTAQLVNQAIQAGFRKIKMKIGAAPVDWDIANIESVCAMLPAGVQMAVDANEAYTVSTALRIARSMERLPNILWFEEPLPIHQTENYATLRSKVDIPLAGGENFQTAADFFPMIASSALDIITPDLLHIGGVIEMNSVIDIAQAKGVRVTPHSFDGALARWAAVQLFSCVQPSGKGCEEEVFDPIEWDVMPNPFTSKIIETSHRVENGLIRLSDEPGLGVTVKREALLQWRWSGETIPSR